MTVTLVFQCACVADFGTVTLVFQCVYVADFDVSIAVRVLQSLALW